jgi:DNA-binding IclR family transcriptional regulator
MSNLVEMLADTHGARILKAIKNAPQGLTDFDLSNGLGTHLSSVNAARNTLMNKGLIAWNGERRPSGRGGMAKVWVAS